VEQGAFKNEDFTATDDEDFDSIVMEELHHEGFTDPQDLRLHLGLDPNQEMTILERHLAAGGEGALKHIPISLDVPEESAERISRQRRLEQDVIMDEQSKAMAQRTKVVAIGRATGFGTTLSLMRRWMPALLKRLQARASSNDEFKELYKMLPPDKLAFLVMERVLSQLLRPDAAATGVPLTIVLRRLVTALRTEVAAHLERQRDPKRFADLRKKTGRMLPTILLQKAAEDKLPLPAANGLLVMKFAAELVDELRLVADVPSAFSAFKVPDALASLEPELPEDEQRIPYEQIQSMATSPNLTMPGAEDVAITSSPPARVPGLLDSIGTSGDTESLDISGAGAITFVRGSHAKTRQLSSSRLVINTAMHQRITMARTVRELAAEMRLAPMLTRPRLWQSATDGPYLITPTYAVRTSNPLQRQLIQRLEPTLGMMYDTLNVLGATPWCINERIYEVRFFVPKLSSVYLCVLLRW
jgi:hypothetical protein